MTDSRPYISGLDEIEYSNWMRSNFKYEGMFEHVKRRIENKLDESDFFEEDRVEVTEAQIRRVLGSVENKLRDDFWELAQELERSRDLNDNYINGLLDAKQDPKEIK